MTVAGRPLLDLAQRLGRGERLRWRLRDRGLDRRRADLVADALLRATHPIEVPGAAGTAGAGGGPQAPRLLVLPKVGGTEDVIAAVGSRPEVPLDLLGLPRQEVKAVFRALVGPGHEQVTDVDHRLGDAATVAGRERYRGFLRTLMARLRAELGVAGVIGANVTYFAERDLAGACEDIGLPFLVLHKESIRSPRQREWFTRAYRERTGPFLGRSVAVYNRSERDSQVAGGVVTDAVVVGAPRVDASHALRGTRADRAADGPAVLFAIDPRAGTWTPFDGLVTTGAPRWDGLARATEDAFLAAARQRPTEPFVIKAKVGHDEQLRARLPEQLPANVRVVTGGTAEGILREARVMVGFNTTVVAEGLAAGVPVVVPSFAEASEPGAQDWCYPVGDAVTRVHGPEELAGALDDARAAGPRTGGLGPAVERTLDELVGNGDGHAARRTAEWIGRELGIG